MPAEAVWLSSQCPWTKNLRRPSFTRRYSATYITAIAPGSNHSLRRIVGAGAYQHCYENLRSDPTHRWCNS